MSKLTDHITNVIGKIIDVHEVNEFDDNFSYSHKISPVDVIEILQEIREMAEEYPPLHDEQPKLSIPKKIAEHDWMKHLIECSNLSQFEFECYDDWLSKDDEQFLEWVKTDKNENILYIYLASKALGVELVEVEG